MTARFRLPTWLSKPPVPSETATAAPIAAHRVRNKPCPERRVNFMTASLDAAHVDGVVARVIAH